MKGAKSSKVLDDLAENLEEVLRTAKENDLCHLIEPLEETISKVKELNRGREVECELTGECNSETCDLHMACSCNDWGPDKLGPDGKWICEICGSACFCDQIWGSCTHLSQTETVKKSLDETNTIKDISLINKNSSQVFQKNSAKCDSCSCSASRKNENQNRRDKKNSPINALASKIVSDPSKKNENEDRTNKEILNLSDSGAKILSGQIWGSCTHFSKKEPVKKSLDETNKIKDILLIKQHSSKSFQKDSFAKGNLRACSVSRKTENQNSRNKKRSPINESASEIISDPTKKNENEDKTNKKILNQSDSGTKCLCGQIWGSCTHFSKKEPVKKSLDETNTIKDILLRKQNSSKSFQKNSSAKCDPCVCSVSRKAENQNRRNKQILSINASASKIISNPSKENKNEDRKNEKTLNQSASGTKCNTNKIDHVAIHIRNIECFSVSKNNESDIDIKINQKLNKPCEKEVSVLYENKQKLKEKLYSEEVRAESLNAEAEYAKKSKCVSCKCTYNEEGNKIKTKECRAASERSKKIMASLEKENNARVEDKNTEVQKEIAKSVEIKISHSTVNFNSFGKDTSTKVLAFEKKGKCGIVICKSSSIGLLDSNDQRCWDEMKAENEERRARQISKCPEKRIQIVPDKYASSRSDRSSQESCPDFPPGRETLEKPEKPLKCSEISGLGRVQKSDERTRNLRKIEPPYNRCPQEVKRPRDTEKCSPGSEEVKRENESPHNFFNCFEIVGQSDEPTENSRKIESLRNRCPHEMKKPDNTEEFSPGSEKVKRENETPHSFMKCFKIEDRGTVQKSDEPTRNSRKIKSPCTRCPQEMKNPDKTEEFSSGSKKMKRETESPHNFFNCFKTVDQSDEPTRNSRKTKSPCNRCPQEVKNPDDTEEFSSGSEKVKREYETSHSFMNCTKIEDRGTVQKSDEPIKNSRKIKSHCNRCPQEMKKPDNTEEFSPGYEKVKRENETPHSFMKCFKIEDRETVQKSDKPPCNRSLREIKKPRDTDKYSPDSEKVKWENESPHNFSDCCKISVQSGGHPTENSARVRRPKMQEKYAFPEEEQRQEMSTMTEGKILDQNLKIYPCNYSNPATSIEKQCPCGCGYFLEGVPTNRPCPCNNALKIPHQEEEIESKKIFPQSRKNDCEGCCEWCSSQ